MFIPDPDLDFLPVPDPGSRGQNGTGSRIRNTGSGTCCDRKNSRKGDAFLGEKMSHLVLGHVPDLDGVVHRGAYSSLKIFIKIKIIKFRKTISCQTRSTAEKKNSTLT
jgi:hypothetical protein